MIVDFFDKIYIGIKGRNPINSIIKAWCIVLAITLLIALYVIITYNHLSISRHGSDKLADLGGAIIKQRFASVSFANYNSYVVLVVFCLPFLFAKLTKALKNKGKTHLLVRSYNKYGSFVCKLFQRRNSLLEYYYR